MACQAVTGIVSNNSIVPNSGINRKTFDINLSQNVTKKLNVTAIANYIDEQDKNRSYLSDGPGNPNNFLGELFDRHLARVPNINRLMKITHRELVNPVDQVGNEAKRSRL